MENEPGYDKNKSTFHYPALYHQLTPTFLKAPGKKGLSLF